MQFTSFEFIIFFPIVVLVFYIVPKKFRQIWLLLASYYFYMGWNAKYAFLILISTLITYTCAVLMEHAGTGSKKKRVVVLTVGLVLNLGILAFYKYFYFLHDTAAAELAVTSWYNRDKNTLCVFSCACGYGRVGTGQESRAVLCSHNSEDSTERGWGG